MTVYDSLRHNGFLGKEGRKKRNSRLLHPEPASALTRAEGGVPNDNWVRHDLHPHLQHTLYAAIHKKITKMFGTQIHKWYFGECSFYLQHYLSFVAAGTWRGSMSLVPREYPVFFVWCTTLTKTQIPCWTLHPWTSQFCVRCNLKQPGSHDFFHLLLWITKRTQVLEMTVVFALWNVHGMLGQACALYSKRLSKTLHPCHYSSMGCSDQAQMPHRASRLTDASPLVYFLCNTRHMHYSTMLHLLSPSKQIQLFLVLYMNVCVLKIPVPTAAFPNQGSCLS